MDFAFETKGSRSVRWIIKRAPLGAASVASRSGVDAVSPTGRVTIGGRAGKAMPANVSWQSYARDAGSDVNPVNSRRGEGALEH